MARGQKTTGAVIELRVKEIFFLLSKGKAPWKICQYVSEKEGAGIEPWAIGEGRKSLSERTIYRYMAKASKRISRHSETYEKRALHTLILLRLEVIDRCMEERDHKTALSAIADLSDILNQYPPSKQKHEHTGADGSPMKVQHSGNVSNAPDLQLADVLFAESLSRRATEISEELRIHPNGESEPLDNGRHSDNGSNP